MLAELWEKVKGLLARFRSPDDAENRDDQRLETARSLQTADDDVEPMEPIMPSEPANVQRITPEWVEPKPRTFSPPPTVMTSEPQSRGTADPVETIAPQRDEFTFSEPEQRESRQPPDISLSDTAEFRSIPEAVTNDSLSTAVPESAVSRFVSHDVPADEQESFSFHSLPDLKPPSEERQRVAARVAIRQAQKQGHGDEASQMAAKERYRRSEVAGPPDVATEARQPPEPTSETSRQVDRAIADLEAEGVPRDRRVKVPPEMQGQERPPVPRGFTLYDQQQGGSGQSNVQTDDRQMERLVEILTKQSDLMSELVKKQDEVVDAIQSLGTSLQNVGGVI